MVAYKARNRVRQLYQSGMNAKQVQQATGFTQWIIDEVIQQIEEAKAKSRQAMIDFRERQKREQIINPIVKRDGKRIPPNPVRCNRCRVLVDQLDDRYQTAICLGCGRKDDKVKMLTSKRMAMLATLLVLLGGCQASRATIDVRVAGQTVKCEFRK